MEFLPLDTLTGKVRGTSSDTGGFITKPIDFSEVYVTGLDLDTGQSGITPLVSGQNYVDVVFGTVADSADWILTECHIVNQTDVSPLNLWPGVITAKSTTGFRLQLNGLPNSANYDLHWAIGISGGGSGGPGITDFLGLTDTPNSYVGQAGKAVKVNAGATALEFGVVSGGSGGDVINVLDYGAKADCVTLFDITFPNGNVVTSAGHTFTAADIGKWAIIRGATGTAPFPGRSPYVGRITAVSGHTATMDVTNTTGLTNLHGATSFPRMDFGTNNAIPFDLACLAVPGPGNRNYYGGTPFAAAGTMNPVLPGDGGTVYIPRGNYLVVGSNDYGAGVSAFWWFETNNLTIKGDGMGQTVLYTTQEFVGALTGGGFAGHGLFQNVTLSDFTMFDLTYFTGAGSTINVELTDNLRYERLEIVNGKGNACLNVQGYFTGTTPLTHRIYIKDCWIHGNVSDGYAPSVFNGIEGDGINAGQLIDVHIEGNRIETPGRHGYEGGGNCYDQYFIGNTIIMTNPAGTSGGLSGINPTGGNTTVVMGNTIKGVGAGEYGIDFTTDIGAWVANDIRVIGNYVKGNMQAAFRFQNTGGDYTVAQHVDRIIVANNWVQGDTNIFTFGVLVRGGDATQAVSMLITGNWFANLGVGFTSVNSLTPVAGKYVVLRNNVFAGQPVGDNEVYAIICEDNVALSPINRYGGGAVTSNIDGQNVLAGAIFSNTIAGIGYVTTDSVEVVRGATTAPSLILWGAVTSANNVTTYAYNPTGGTLNTGATTKFIVHRRAPP